VARRSARSPRSTAVQPRARWSFPTSFRPAATTAEAAADDAARARYLPASARYVLAVGQAAGYKTHATLIEAFRRAFGPRDGIHLVVVQRLGRDAATMRAARAASLWGRVHLLPELPREHLVALYRGALALAHVSWHEGWGMPLTEAMACGCAVVASSGSAMPEVTGGAALLGDAASPRWVGDALRAVAGDESLRQAMIERGLERVRGLSWKEHARRTAGVYREVLNAELSRPDGSRAPAG
jgi:glycosyltransferase involved in cell wall biosynthesis